MIYNTWDRQENERYMTQTVPSGIIDILRCISCKQGKLRHDSADTLVCSECGHKYETVNGIPSIIDKELDQEWNSHDSDAFEKGADSYYKRAKGDLPEKEASKSLARLLDRKDIYSQGDRLLDVGCAAGHFLKSLRRLLDSEIQYTGVDTDMKYLQWGRDVYGVDETCTFVQSDALEMPFEDNSFDTVFVNLFHFFPRIDNALSESVRVSKDRVIWRTPIGETTYIIKEIFEDEFEDVGIIDPERTDLDYSLYMLYSEEYLTGLVDEMGWEIEFFERDDDFESFDNTDEFEDVPATKTVNGKQINGNMVLDWHYVSIVSD